MGKSGNKTKTINNKIHLL